MISLAKMAKQVEKFTIDNSPTVLTAIGTAGVITTAILTAKGAFKASDILRREEADRAVQEESKPIDTVDKVKLTWLCYLPAVGSGVLTCGAVIGSSQISTRRAAALAAAYSLSEKKIEEYKAKVVDKFGDNKEEEVRAELAQERVAQAVSGNKMIIVGDSEQLCYDDYSDRIFTSTVEDIKAAVNKINHQIHNEGYASLTDFYREIGLPETGFSDEIGWQLDKLLDVKFATTLTPDGRPAISIEFSKGPITNYFRLG